MEPKYPNIVRAVSETPWAILPATLEAIKHFVALRAEGVSLSDEEIKARIGDSPAHKQTSQQGVVAVLPIYGVITPKADLMSDISGGTSIETFAADFRSVLADDAVKAIVLDIDSPGGQTTLIPEMAAEIRAGRGAKPIVAVANSMAASAAYWLGSQADEFVVTPSGSVGSIGVFAAHDDISGLQAQLGVKTTLISAGKDKTLGNQFEPLSDEARQMIQDRVDEMFGMFTSDIAKGRGVSPAQVTGGFGEGRMVSAQNAVKEGMADRVATFDQTIARVANPNGRSRIGTSTSGTVSIHVEGVVANAGPIQAHSTPTTDSAWDGPQAKANLRNDGDEAYYRSAFAWQDDNTDPNLKGSYKFIHHQVNPDGDVGAANLTACSQGIAVLNGGRTGTTIPDSDRQGVYNHLAKHLSDGGKEPPPLQQAADSGLSFADEADQLLRSLEAVVDRTETLRVLTGAKREQLTALVERCESVLNWHDPTKTISDDTALDLAFTLARLRSQ